MVIDNIKDGILTTIYRFMRDFDRDVNSFDVYICVVYVLYGIHKQYTAVEQKSSSIFFFFLEDELLNDIYEHIKEKNHEIHLYMKILRIAMVKFCLTWQILNLSY